MARFAFESFPLRRVQASAFGWIPASARVLEECGYQIESRVRSIGREGEVTDELLCGLLGADVCHVTGRIR